jgi:hypothetical protein
MDKATQFSILLPNQPGELAELCRALANARVNILAISVVETSEHGMIRLVVDDPEAAAKAIERRGDLYTRSEVFIGHIGNQPGALADLTEKLADEGIDVKYVYGTSMADAGQAALVLAVEHAARAEKVLRGL